MHCLASEPEQTFLRVAVLDHTEDEKGTEVAFETAVLGRLRPGYRVKASPQGGEEGGGYGRC